MCYRVKRNVEEYGCTDVNIFPLVEHNPTTCHAAQSYRNTPELVLELENSCTLTQTILSFRLQIK